MQKSKTIRVKELKIIADYIENIKEVSGLEITETQAVDSLLKIAQSKLNERRISKESKEWFNMAEKEGK